MPEIEEKRIFVVVAEKVKAAPLYDEHTEEVVQPAGRIAAQVGHVVSKVRVMEIAADTKRAPYFQPFTTIVLSARNSAELLHVAHVLTLGAVEFEVFDDTNDEYGYPRNAETPYAVMTAIATYPIERSKLEGLIDHLPLWKPTCPGASLKGRDL